jgi:Tol biopolymer transport system component
VEVYVNGAAAPSLVVDDLGEASSGGVALWVGNGSDGAFADLTITATTDGFPRLTGPYLGQDPPGGEPVLFAPGVVSTGMYTRDVAMTPDGSEIYFGVLLGRFSAILQTRLVDGEWTEPEVAPFSRDARFFSLEPAISPDGKRFMFLSSRLGAGREPTAAEIRSWTNHDIWVMDREGDGWGEPWNLGPPVNTEGAEFFPSLTRDGTLYFTRGSDDGRESAIWRSRLVGGRYQEPEKLGPEVNSTPSQFNAFVAPDESYLILSTAGRPDTRGGSDYYVVFRTPDDQWSEPINLGDEVNTRADAEFSPYVSPDGKYFFFMSPRPLPDADIPPVLSLDWLRRFRAQPGSGNPAIYWMDARFIEQLRPAAPER